MSPSYPTYDGSVNADIGIYMHTHSARRATLFNEKNATIMLRARERNLFDVTTIERRQQIKRRNIGRHRKASEISYCKQESRFAS